MKRYRIFNFDYDTRPSLLTMEIGTHWEVPIKDIHQENKNQIKSELLGQYGTYNNEEKTKNFTDIGNKPVCIQAFHNEFLDHIRQSYVM